MTFFTDLFAVAAGGALGASLRHITTQVVVQGFAGPAAIGTVLSNIAGCAAMGLVVASAAPTQQGIAPAISPTLLLAIRVGGIGGLTTFSTFIAEAAALWGKSSPGAFWAYLFSNLAIGGTAFWMAATLAKKWMGAAA